MIIRQLQIIFPFSQNILLIILVYLINSYIFALVINHININIMYLQLFKDGKELLGSDGCMQVDGRLSVNSVIQEVKKRNASFASNFPHKVCDSFGIYSGRIGSKITRTINI